MFRYLLILLTFLLACPAHAAEDPAAAFGARESIQNIALSPDGTQLAFIAPTTGTGNGLYIVPVDKHQPPKRIVLASGAPESLRSCDWVTNTRLICVISAIRKSAGTVVSGARWFALDSDAKNVKPLYGNLVDLMVDSGNGEILVGYSYGESSGVDQLNTINLKSKTIGIGLPLGRYYLSDGYGNVRVGGSATRDGDYQGKQFKYMYRRPNETGWLSLGLYDSVARTGFLPSAVDPAKNVVYGLSRLDGRTALYTISLDGSLNQQLVFSRPDVDIDNVIGLGRRRRVVGATFVTDRRQSVYFDTELAKLRDALGRLFPAGAVVDFSGASDNEKKLLVRVSSDTDPGTYYIYDKGNRHLDKVILARPELTNYLFSPVKMVEVKARDGTNIPAYLTLPANGPSHGLPTIVMPHGGPEARDELGFDWLAQYFANRGYAVLQPNFRGSSGYGDAWFSRNAYQSWAIAIGDVTDSGEWLVSQGIADPARLAIVGWSYGGYAGLQSGVVAPRLFKAIVAIAPVTDLDMLKSDASGYSDKYLWKDYVGGGANAVAGSPARHANVFAAPVLMFHGDLDRNVSIRQSRLMDGKLHDAGKSSRLVVYSGLDHQLDDAAARSDMLRQTDAFLRSTMAIK